MQTATYNSALDRSQRPQCTAQQPSAQQPSARRKATLAPTTVPGPRRGVGLVAALLGLTLVGSACSDVVTQADCGPSAAEFAACEGTAVDAATDTGARSNGAGSNGAGSNGAGSNGAVLAQGDYAPRGVHAVGYRQFELPGGDGAATLLKAWYPTTSTGEGSDSVEYEVTFKMAAWGPSDPAVIHGHARLDAPIDAEHGRFPVVVFSHGFGTNPEWYSVLLEHLTSYGFVVLAPEHQEGDWFETVVQSTFDRPRDVRTTLDFAEALTAVGGPFEGLLDMDRVGLVGHSYGGYTALAVAGARLNLDGFSEECAGVDDTDPKMFLCSPFMGQQQQMADAAGLERAPQGQWPPQADARVKAIVPIAGDAFLFGAEGLAHVTVPTMALGGTADLSAPWEWGAQLTYDSVSSEDALLVGLQGGDHMLAMNTCDDMPWTDELPDDFNALLCQDPAWERADALALIRHLATAFLLDTLVGNDEARQALSPAAVQRFAGIEYTSTR